MSFFSNNSELNPIINFFPLIFVVIIFYFLMIRPQQKKAKVQSEFLGNLKIDEEIVLNSGIIGKIIDIKKDSDIVKVEISDGIEIEVQKNSIEIYKNQLK